MIKRIFLGSFIFLFFSTSFGAPLESGDFNRAKRIAVYVGTFNPPHLGHQRIAIEGGLAVRADYVLVLPLPTAFHKVESLEFSDRLHMTQLAFAEEKNILVPSGQDNRSARQIIKKIKLYNPNIEFIGLVGSDYVQSKLQWFAQRIFQGISGINTTAVFLRDPAELQALNDIRSENVETYILSEINQESSTEVRKGNISMVNPAVADYILVHKLYMNFSSQSCSTIFTL